MKFFVPPTKDDAQAKRIYESARSHCETQTGWRVLPKKIHALRYRHNGREYLTQVGYEDPSDGLVVCIFESEEAYLVCTPQRGVLGGHPILIGLSEVSDVELFENA